MLQGKSETDSPARKLKVGLLGLLAGAAALAALLAGLAAASTGVQAQEAGATYTGPIDVIVGGQCGGGTISFTVSEDGSSISQLVLDGAYAGGFLVNSLSDPAGSPFVVAFDPDIAIGADGSFSLSFPVAGVDTYIEGHFDGDTVSGIDSVATFGCVDVPFSAEVGAEAPAAVPQAGSGGYLDQRSSGLPMVAWLALAGASLAVLCLGVGLWARTRRVVNR